jgi:hypothetical protein
MTTSPTRQPVRLCPAKKPLLLAAALAALSGCARPLLSPQEERTPYDRYDSIRAQTAPQYIEDEYGMQKPNLRGRLTPRE